MRAFLVFGAALVALGASSTAHADTGESCDEAFERSQEKRDDGKLLEARRLLRVCSAPTCSPTEQKLCSQWSSDVDARMPSFVLSATDGAGAELVDVKVRMDGSQIATRLDGRAIDVDPGPHSFVFELPDGAKAETTVVAEEHGKGKVVSVRLGAAAATPSASSAEASSGSTLKTAGMVLGAVGVAGLALGTVFGVVALATKGSDCSNGFCNPGSASTAYHQADVSTAGLVAGGVLLAGGVTLFLVAPKHDKAPSAAFLTIRPLVGPSARGVELLGRW
jgi:hypothetical protein